MTTKKAMQLFVHALDHRYYAVRHSKKAKTLSLRALRFPAGVLKTLAACQVPMLFNDTQIFRALFREDDYPTPSCHRPSWKDDAEHWRLIERARSIGELNDATYIAIKKLLPITYADAVVIVRKANEENRGASTEDVRDCIMSLESHGAGELPPHLDVGMESESETDRFLTATQATLLRWRLIQGYDWAFVRGALLRLFQMARKEWRR